ncbi:hypothetical protein IFM89_011567 [Coptis chinensis]|uniref:Cysteine-rich receptor-like protein kinase n=1 Tax=Coptis chinensis TaxID=261450 RepID=A0A835LUK8_9MAGN|nr:hypothetical protein IFM89_011567 [Coptis chinensis]
MLHIEVENVDSASEDNQIHGADHHVDHFPDVAYCEEYDSYISQSIPLLSTYNDHSSHVPSDNILTNCAHSGTTTTPPKQTQVPTTSRAKSDAGISKQKPVEIIRKCPNGKEATLRYDTCILRYSNTWFFSQVDGNLRGTLVKPYVPDADANANRYNSQLDNLLKNLSNTAASVAIKFAAGSTHYSTFNVIYGLAMCTRDLSDTQCFSCLQSMVRWIPTCCNNSVGAHIFTTICNIKYEISPFFKLSSPSPHPPPQSNSGTGNGKSVNVVAIVVPAIVAVLLAAICTYFITRRIRKNRRKKKLELIYDNDIRSEESLQFDFNMIRTATNDFSDANKLGEGGFGAVYKGELLDGLEIAVKRLSKNSGQGSLEFKNEVILLHKLQHRNLVRLLGFCLAGEEKLLIYEYIPNRSLNKYIFGLSH